MLIFHKNLPVIPARMVKYFEAPEFRNGGTGAPRRLGLAAAMLAGFTLFVSMLLADAGVMVATMPQVAVAGQAEGATGGTGRRAGHVPAATGRPGPPHAARPAAAAASPASPTRPERLPHQNPVSPDVRADGFFPERTIDHGRQNPKSRSSSTRPGQRRRGYNAAMRDGSIPAIGREAVKDVRNTIHEVFFGRGERGSRAGHAAQSALSRHRPGPRRRMKPLPNRRPRRFPPPLPT